MSKQNQRRMSGFLGECPIDPVDRRHLLLKAGDIETNPGPYQCGACNRNVTNRDYSILCRDCRLWFHRKCVRMTIKEILDHEGVCETETTNERTPHTPIEHLWFTIQVYYPDETYRGMPGRHRPSTRDEAHRKRRPSVCPEELDAISKRQKDPHKWHHPTSRRSTDASSPGIRLRTHQGLGSEPIKDSKRSVGKCRYTHSQGRTESGYLEPLSPPNENFRRERRITLQFPLAEKCRSHCR